MCLQASCCVVHAHYTAGHQHAKGCCCVYVCLLVCDSLLKDARLLTLDVCRVPEALQPFMPKNLDFIPFRKQIDPKTKKLIPRP